MKYNTHSTSLSVGRSVRVYTPLGTLFCPLVFHVSELYDEISDHLPFNSSTWSVLYNSLNSIAHSAIRPAASGLLIARRKGLLVKTTIMWAWKYGLSLRAAVIKAKASFSIGEYLSSTPRSARLV